VPASGGRSASARILLVDDDVSVTDAFSRTLRLEGFEVWAALSGEEAIALAGKHVPHALVLDLRMPLASGLQLLRSLRAVPGLANVPAAIVTGDYHSEHAHLVDARDLGAEVKFKPLWLDELVTLARGLLSVPVRD